MRSAPLMSTMRLLYDILLYMTWSMQEGFVGFVKYALSAEEMNSQLKD
jgi:hypothetical protein